MRFTDKRKCGSVDAAGAGDETPTLALSKAPAGKIIIKVSPGGSLVDQGGVVRITSRRT